MKKVFLVKMNEISRGIFVIECDESLDLCKEKWKTAIKRVFAHGNESRNHKRPRSFEYLFESENVMRPQQGSRPKT